MIIPQVLFADMLNKNVDLRGKGIMKVYEKNIIKRKKSCK